MGLRMARLSWMRPRTPVSLPRPNATTGSCTLAARSPGICDTHMFETLEHLLEAGGPGSKAVVWAHNSHIGDARYTDMGVVREQLIIGQLCRERFGQEAALIGFG